ncbi:hypothetical protein D1R32_gp071 [Tunisvirus fontaine2]|uniref:Uncharacterized protein n=1 Tax=Tunisvirus fontaine2 TaxID=1421067 RepID=V9SD34_9VIRU|nr:hypothetical protein D1R32_gp071 [Tunisvirus fontaine2]AHC54788.1 hypothetical protein TNS_ORF70 [Tunisvirus fontaine2]
MESWEKKQKVRLEFTLHLEGATFSGKINIKDPERMRDAIKKYFDEKSCLVEFSKDFTISSCMYQGIFIEYKGCSLNVKQEYNHYNLKKVREFLSEVLEKLDE